MFNQKNIDIIDKKRTIVHLLSSKVCEEATKILCRDSQWEYFKVALKASLYTISNDFLAIYYGHKEHPFYSLVSNPQQLQKSLTEHFALENSDQENLADSIALTFGGTDVKNIDDKLKIIELEASMAGWIKFISKPENSKRLIETLSNSYALIYKDSWVEEEKRLAPQINAELDASLERLTEKVKQKFKDAGYDDPLKK